MSILDVTEDQIFQTLGRGRDPNFKPIEKVRPAIARPKKTYSINKTVKPQSQTAKPPVVQPSVEPVKAEPLKADPVQYVPSPAFDESMLKFTVELNELNIRVNGIQKMVKWYLMPQFVVVLVLLLALILRS